MKREVVEDAASLFLPEHRVLKGIPAGKMIQILPRVNYGEEIPFVERG